MNVTARNPRGHAFTEFGCRLVTLAISHITNSDFVTGRQQANRIHQFTRVAYFSAVDFDDYILDLKTCLFGGRIRRNLDNHRARIHGHIERFGGGGVDWADRHTEEPAMYLAEIKNLPHD